MTGPVVHTLTTPSGRIFQMAIAKDGTRVVAAHLHKREMLTIAVALEAAVEHARNHGRCAEQRECEALRDMFLKALHHDA